MRKAIGRITSHLLGTRNKKRCLYILFSLIAGVWAFCVLSPAVYADSVTSENGSITVNHRSGNAITYGDYIEYNIRNDLIYTIDNFSKDKAYIGYYNLHLPLSISISNARAFNVQLSEVIVPDIFEYRLNTTYPLITYNDSNYWSSTLNLTVNLSLFLRPDKQYIGQTHINVNIKFKMDYGVNSPNTPSWVYNWDNSNITSSTSISSYPRDGLTLVDIYDRLGSTNSALVSAINNSASQAHTDSTAEKAAINSAASQAHTDSQTINNNLLNDSSGSSQNSASVQSAYQTANQAADQAVDAAVHNYDSELAQVQNVNFNNFFTSQTSAVTFWRDVGEYILDSSNLGYIASGLIIVTLIGLFVYLLRL